MELKKTGIAPIVKCPTKTVGGKQCQSAYTIHWCFVRFRRISTLSLEYFTLSC